MKQVCWPDGNPATAEVMFVGDGPGTSERAQGKPFVGVDGRLLWEIGTQVGLDRSRTYSTLAVQSWPTLKSGKPSAAQLREEWDRFDAELEAFQGEILVPVGGVALRRLMGLPSITDYRGYVLRPCDGVPIERTMFVREGEYKSSSSKKGYKIGDPKFVKRKVYVNPKLPPNVKYILPIMDPMTVRQMSYATVPALKADLDRVSRAVNDKLDLIGDIPYEEHAFLPEVGIDRVTIDIETPYDGNWIIDRVSMAWYHGEEVVCWTAPWNWRTSDILREIWTDPEITKEFHNGGAFDRPRIDHALGDSMQGKMVCTMWGAHFLQPDLPKGLEKVAPLYADVVTWKKGAQADPVYYSAMDAYVQCVIGRTIMKLIDKTGQRRVFEDMMLALPVVHRMHMRGIRCDRERTAKWVAQQVNMLETAVECWPWPEVNYDSPKQLQKLLYYTLRVKKQYAKGGGLTVDAAALIAIKYGLEKGETCAGDPATIIAGLGTLVKIRELTRNIRYYGKVAIGDDDCVHPDYVPGDREEHTVGKDRGQGARTGRIQPRRPNISNTHEEARCLYIPHEDEWVFISGDWQQAEAWVEAYLTGDENLIEALESGLHDYVQQRLGCKRRIAKATWFGSRNLASPKTLCTNAKKEGMLDATIKQFEEAQAELYRAFGVWANKRIAWCLEAEAQQYVREPFGRRYGIYCKGRLRPRIVGYKPQAAIGSLLWRVLPQVDAACERFGGHLVLTMHDEVLLECRQSSAAELIVAVKAIMEQELPEIAEGFQLRTDFEIGRPGESWGDMNKRYKDMT